VVFVPMMILGGVLNPVVPRTVERFGPRVPIVGGQVLMAAALVALAALPGTVPVWVLSLVMLPIGFAAPFINPPMTALLLEHVDGKLAGTASGMYNTARQIGGAIAIAVFGTLIATNGALGGMRVSMLIAAVGVVATAVACTGRALAHSR
jgi:MFS transporter, DHA2 family, methylenomycin A resistance protein